MEVKEPIFIDTNIIEGIGKQILSEHKKNRYKPLKKVIDEILKHKIDGILVTLFENYSLFTSRLSKYEFLHSKDKGKIPDLREIYDSITSYFKISTIPFTEIENFLTCEFFESLLKYDIDLADGMQVLLAAKKSTKKKGLIFVTGNENHIPKMRKLWSKVYSVRQIYEKLKKEGKLKPKK